MTTIAANLQAVHDRIARALHAAGRNETKVTLLAVSKGVSAARVLEAFRCGQRAYGENYVQEALAKMDALRDTPLEWHYIGPIQSNKTRAIAERFHWVHSIDRVKVAQRLAAARPANMPPLNVCMQLNVSGETTKGGISPGEERALAQAIAALPQLRLRGLMAIPEPTSDIASQRRRYAAVRVARDRLVEAGYALDTLSMGMSNDLEAAIAEGATIVRIGTAIFGARP
ncbi:MAG TPA: YggS family pyridoxal phosphate-dependent enzyme [Burkholderiales bacterium]